MHLQQCAYLVGMVTVVNNNVHPPVPVTSVTRLPDIVLNHVILVSMATGVMKPVATTVSGAVGETVENVLFVLYIDTVIFVRKFVATTVKQLTVPVAYVIETVATVLVDAKIQCLALPATTTAEPIVSSVIILIPVFPVYLTTGGSGVKNHAPLIVFINSASRILGSV